ncbi:MAG: Hpt domain-containing protein [Gemmatimonadaceae bacterium]
MSSSVGLLEFFALEASDYIERLDRALSGTAGSPDSDEFARSARLLRGSATMARQMPIAEIAGALERVGRSLREGRARWDPALGGALIAAVDDLRILVRAIRAWGPEEDRRAGARIAELERLVPSATRPPTPTPSGGAGTLFLSGAASEIATALEAFVARPTARAALDAALQHVRALRGVAAIRDLPPLPDVVDALERAAKPLELGNERASAEIVALFASAARLLRQTAADLRSGAHPRSAGPELDEFRVAAARIGGRPSEGDHIVPIADLFFDDGAAGLVEATASPPTTPAQRFRLEVVSQAEHLRRVIADARAAEGTPGRDRAERELRDALRALRRAAESFGESDVAGFLRTSGEAAASLDANALQQLDGIAALLADPRTEPRELRRRLGDLATASPGQRDRAPVHAGRVGAPGAQHPRRAPTPTGSALHSMLQSGIAGLGQLSTRPLSQPVPLIDPTLVPIDKLLYRGRAALDRALELRAEMRANAGAPRQDSLDELYDLLELAAVD